jgi:two-component system, NarL family, sensor kinase
MPRNLDEWLSVTLTHLLLGAYLFVVYASILAVGGVTDDSPVPWWLNAISVTLLFLTLRPMHSWLRTGVHSVVYGQYDNPYAVLSEVQERAEGEPTPAALLPAVAETIAGSLKLPYVAIVTELDDSPFSASAGTAIEGAEVIVVPLTYHGLQVGRIEAGARRAGAPLSGADMKLLSHLARQVGITVHAAQLSAALSASRQQIITAREEERRRIRRDLHDGLGPTLASLRLQLGAVKRQVRIDPAAAEDLIESLRADVVAATADIRRLVYQLRPPMLDEFGLAGALRNLGNTQGSVPRHVDLPDDLPPLSAATEVALYRIAVEAVQNVDQHAQATSCWVSLSVTNDAVVLTVVDDGIGMPDEVHRGVGTTSMAERAAELGGRVSWRANPAEMPPHIDPLASELPRRETQRAGALPQRGTTMQAVLPR